MVAMSLMEAAVVAAIASIRHKVDEALQGEAVWIYRYPAVETDDFDVYVDTGEEVWITFSASPFPDFTYRLRVGFHEWDEEFDYFILDVNLDERRVFVIQDEDREFDEILDLGDLIQALAVVDRDGNLEMERKRLEEHLATERKARMAKFTVIGGGV